MPNPIDFPKLSRPSLPEMSVEDAKKVGQKYAAFLTSLRVEILNECFALRKAKPLSEMCADLWHIEST